MKKKEKRMILFLLLVLAVIIIVVVVKNNGAKGKANNNVPQGAKQSQTEEYVAVKEDGTKVNTSKKLNEDKKLDNLVFSNIQLTERNGQSVLLADVTNTGNSATELMDVYVVFLDKNGKEIDKVNGMVAPLQSGAKTQFNTGITEDYANAYDIKIVKK